MSNNFRSRRWWPYVVAGGVVLFIGIIWLGTREEPIEQRVAPLAVTEIVVSIQAPSLNTRARTPTPLTWVVGGPVGKTATHTSIHWDAASHPGTFEKTVSPQASGYPSNIPDYVRGAYAIPRTFSGVVTFSTPGTYSYRAHAIIDGEHYWSPEYSIRVE